MKTHGAHIGIDPTAIACNRVPSALPTLLPSTLAGNLLLRCP